MGHRLVVTGGTCCLPRRAILRGLTWILEGGAAGSPPGLQPYPAELEREIAELARATRS